MPSPRDRFTESAVRGRLDVEPKLLAHVADLGIARITETVGEQDFDGPSETDYNAGRRSEPKHHGCSGRRNQAKRGWTVVDPINVPREVLPPVAPRPFNNELGFKPVHDRARTLNDSLEPFRVCSRRVVSLGRRSRVHAPIVAFRERPHSGRPCRHTYGRPDRGLQPHPDHRMTHTQPVMGGAILPISVSTSAAHRRSATRQSRRG